MGKQTWPSQSVLAGEKKKNNQFCHNFVSEWNSISMRVLPIAPASAYVVFFFCQKIKNQFLNTSPNLSAHLLSSGKFTQAPKAPGMSRSKA